jgi:hypothetical protein
MTTTVKPARQDRTTMTLLLIAAAVAIGGISFAIGHVTAGSGTAAATPALGRGGFGPGAGRSFSIPSLAPGQTFDTSQFGGNGRGGFGGGTQGTVQSISGGTLTIKLANGSTMTINLTGTTTYHKEDAASQSDITTGSTVRVTVAGGANGNPGATPAPGATTAPRTASDVTLVSP